MLGDRLVHLERAPRCQGLTFKHIVCEDDRPEDELVESYSYTNSNGDVETFWRQSHHDCDKHLSYHPGLDPKRWGHESMHLKVLRVCRQIYSEANHVLWTTNTFSFRNTFSFDDFMEERTNLQRRLLKSLRLQMNWAWGDDLHWKHAFSTTTIISLAGLRNLRLQINHSVEAGFYQRAKTCGNKLALFEPKHLAVMHRLALFPLIDVEVFVGVHFQQCNHDAYGMARNRKEYAEAIRKVLLDPNGAQTCLEAMQQGRLSSTGQRGGKPGS